MDKSEHPDNQTHLAVALGAAILLASVAVAVAEFTGFAVFDSARDAGVLARVGAEAHARKEVDPKLLFPLQYDATVVMSGPDIKKPRTAYYVRPENRKP